MPPGHAERYGWRDPDCRPTTMVTRRSDAVSSGRRLFLGAMVLFVGAWDWSACRRAKCDCRGIRRTDLRECQVSDASLAVDRGAVRDRGGVARRIQRYRSTSRSISRTSTSSTTTGSSPAPTLPPAMASTSRGRSSSRQVRVHGDARRPHRTECAVGTDRPHRGRGRGPTDRVVTPILGHALIGAEHGDRRTRPQPCTSCCWPLRPWAARSSAS